MPTMEMTEQPPAERLAERRKRLQVLEAERAQTGAALDRARAELGRAVAGDAPPGEQRTLRAEIADLATQVDGLDAAIPLMAAEIEPLEAEVQAAELERLEAEADRLEEEWRQQYDRTHRKLIEVAREFAATRMALTTATAAMTEARRAALRAAGAPRDEIHAAERKDRRLPLGDREKQETFEFLARAVSAFAAANED
jgi:chromosome segregation protein